MKKLKILLLITQLELAGAQKALFTLAHGLQKREHYVTVVTMYDKGNYCSQFKNQFGVTIINLQMKKDQDKRIWQKLKSFITGIFQLFYLLISGNYDVIQTFSHYSNILGPFIAFFSRIPVRVTSQRMSLKGASRWLLLLDRLVNNSFLVHKMVAVSEETKRFCIELEKIHPQKLTTIINSINLDRYSKGGLDPKYLTQLRQDLGFSESDKLIIVIARLHPQKGHHFLIQSIPQITKVFPASHFLLVGDGELRHELMDQTQQLGVDKKVHFLGVRNDIPELLAISDIFVLPSLWEGFPNSLLEAMAMEIPVITTEVDGCKEIINNELTGLLVPPANTQELERAISRLLENKLLCKKLSDNAYQWVTSNCNEESFISAFEILYRSFSKEKLFNE